jgi:hypothetical protein
LDAVVKDEFTSLPFAISPQKVEQWLTNKFHWQIKCSKIQKLTMLNMFQKQLSLMILTLKKRKLQKDNLWNVWRKHCFRLKHLKKRTNKV